MLVGMALFLFVGWKVLTFFEQLLKGTPAPPPVISSAGQKTDSIQAPPHTFKVIPVAIAWLIGAFIYFASVLDGFESLIFQPIIAAVVSGICVSMAYGIGLLLRVSPLGKFWSSTWFWAWSLGAVSLLVLMFGASLGMSHSYSNPETQQQFTGLHPAAGITAYFTLLFAIANWPIRRPYAT